MIKIERSPSPIIILPSLAAVQNVADVSDLAKDAATRMKAARQNAIDAWHLNNSHANKRSMQQQKVMTALKTAGGRRGQFALFASSMGAAHGRKTMKAAGKSTVITPMSSRSNSQNTSNNSSIASNTTNGNGVNDLSNITDTSATGNSKLIKRQDIKRESLGTSKDMLYLEGDSKPWACKMCKRTYKWKNSLNCHIKNECGKPPKFFCERMCGYKTNIHSNMKRHMNSNCKPRSAV